MLLLFLQPFHAFSDGNGQLQPTDSSESKIQIMPFFSWFAMYNCPEEYRLYIHVNSVNEKICLGFGNIKDVGGAIKHDVLFRIKDPSGNIVLPADTVPYSGTGYINSFSEVVAGPSLVSPSGYAPVVFQPTTTGDYYIEFEMPWITGSLVVQSPEPRIFRIGTANFGPSFNASLFCSDIAYLPDSNGLYTGCTGYAADTFMGKIALIDRGACFFTTKVFKAQQAGALGVIIVNNQPGGGVMNMAIGDSAVAAQITIPSCFISWENGQDIKQWLASGNVNVCFGDSSYGEERRLFDLFDISVVSQNNTLIGGRVWSKAWQFTTVPFSGSSDPFLDKFLGKVFIYSVDSITTSFDFNGMQPYVFTMAANLTGCYNTGDLVNDRKSVGGLHTYPQYKVFLNTPDSLCYPSGHLGKFNSPVKLNGCYHDSLCFTIDVNKQGKINILINLNDTAGFQPGSADVFLSQYVTQGVNCVYWDGRNGFGEFVPNETQIPLFIRYFNCETHTPLFDIEGNETGFKINVVRPYNPDYTPPLFWDDTNIPNDGTAEYTGCSDTAGCHLWSDSISCSGNMPCSIGDQKTINTWWYASVVDTNFIYTLDFLRTDIHTGNVSCFDSTDGYVSLHTAGGTPAYTYTWNNFPGNHSDSISNLGQGAYIFSIDDSIGCSFSDTAFVSQPQPIQFIIDSVENIKCFGDSTGSIFTTTQGGTSPYQFNIPLVAQNNTGDFTSLPVGYYYLYVFDANNCTSMVETALTEPQELVLTLDSIFIPVCYGDSTGAVYITATGGSAPYIFQWNNQNSSEDVVHLLPGNYSITITDGHGCEISADTLIPAVPQIIITTDSIVHVKCNTNNGAIYTTLSGGEPPLSVYWSPIAQTTDDITGLAPGNYNITVTDSIGCTHALTPITINRLHQENMTLSETGNKSCKGQCTGSATITVYGGTLPLSYFWNDGATSQMHIEMCAGNYTVYVSDKNTCIDSISLDISEYLSQLLITGKEVKNVTCGEKCNGEISFSATGGIKPYTFLFNNEETDTLIKNLCKGMYYLSVNDSVNCRIADSIMVSDMLISENEVPNVITPNDDNLNDIFIYNTPCETLLMLEIFDRWGNMIYRQEATHPNWDGRNGAGVLVSFGTYYYIIKAVNNPKRFTKTGFIQVVY
ncbi:MAG: gliding motility-associated C-terminal domain-containing protein [Bacteroidia bacterium]|nr:gliding motility-associated C-terminal domain-containing protein [Bacteroidia bacterium]